ncbi:MAG: xanthine dehydrogenase family protein molybdopterin-binding subunit, partial [Chloroflexota bacterium]
GQRVPKIEGAEKVTGGTPYTADVQLPGLLWGKVLRSPHPYARITRIDASAARALPGVTAVITAHDIPYVLAGRRLKDVPPLARDVVRFVGERVAAVAAEDPNLAQEALNLIEVEYEELEPLLDPREAMKPGTPLLHPDIASYQGLPANLPADVPNIHSFLERKRGDLEVGFAEADQIIESTYECAMMHQAYLEPHSCLVNIDDTGRVHVWATNKSPYTLRTHVAQALELDESNVVVEHTRIGGEFGGKGAVMDIPIAYYLAKFTGAPIRIVMTYTEEFLAGNPRHPSIITFKTGVKRDGTITAHQARTVFDSGAYGGFKPVPDVSLGGGVKTGGCYRIPHLLLQAYIAYTNHIPGGFMRAPGDPQAAFAVESHFDVVARTLGVDPLEFRRKNIIQQGEAAASGPTWSDMIAPDVLERAIEASDWHAPRRPNVGKGLAVIHRHQGGGESKTRMTLNPDGRVVITTGVPDAGQGSHTMMKQLAAEVLTIPMNQIDIAVGNTDEAPSDPGIGGARHGHIAGQGAFGGAQELFERMRSALAEEMGWQEDRITLEDGAFKVEGQPGDSATFTRVAEIVTRLNSGPIDFIYTYNKPSSEQECFIAQVAEVEVDPDTGAFQILKFVTAHDAGTLINPMMAEGQIEGGFVQGLGFSVMEEMRLDDGRVTNGNFGDYKIPTIADIPELQTVWLDAVGPIPFSGKAVAEHSLIPTAAAIANAIDDAVGVRITSTPITAEKVFAALQVKRTER